MCTQIQINQSEVCSPPQNELYFCPCGVLVQWKTPYYVSALPHSVRHTIHTQLSTPPQKMRLAFPPSASSDNYRPKRCRLQGPCFKNQACRLQYCGLMSPCFCTKGGQCQPTTLCHLLHYNMLYNRWAAMSLHYSISVTHFTTNRAQLQHIHHHVGIHHTVRMAQRH